MLSVLFLYLLPRMIVYGWSFVFTIMTLCPIFDRSLESLTTTEIALSFILILVGIIAIKLEKDNVD